MIKVIPNQVVCEKCMAKLEYEISDVIETITERPYMEFKPDNNMLLGGTWVVNGLVKVVNKHIECPICKTKINLQNYEYYETLESKN